MEKENPVFRSLEIIENRISEKLTVENIAGSVYFSKYHYSRLFREIVGDSVMEYVTKRKLTLAGRELLETDGSILDIALKFGYESHEGFTRGFKAYMGVTPTEYRRYGLAAISHEKGKERYNMTYSKTTDEMIRELNGLIVKTKETAEYARRCEVPEYVPFWNMAADITDTYADRVKGVLTRITAIAERPDEITNRFAIIRVIEDIAFNSNLLALNAGLMVSRLRPEHTAIFEPLSQRYLELAYASSIKAGKIAQFLNELASLIFDDMRKTAAQKLDTAVQKGRAAAAGIIGYDYIKLEIVSIANRLSSTPPEDVAVWMLEDYMFRLDIISLTADMDVFRNPEDKPMFGGIAEFRESLGEAADFFRTLIKPEENPALERTGKKSLQDIAFQGNVLLFYTRGEIEKLGNAELLDGKQKAALESICARMNSFIQLALEAEEDKAYKEIADLLNKIHSDMIAEAEKLADKGGAVRFIAVEAKGFADAVMKCIKE